MKDNKIKKDDEIKGLKEHIKELEKAETKLKQEIERQKLTEEKIRESEEKYRILFETAKDSIFITNESGKFIDVNQAACKSLGYTKEELVKISNKDIDAEITGYEAFKKIRNGLAENITFEINQKKKDGTLLPVEITGNFYNIGDKKFALAIARDLSKHKQAKEALKESEKKYRTLVESLREGIATVDENENFTFVNQATCNIFGYSKKELLQMNFKGLIAPEDYQKLLKQTSIRKTGKSSEYDLNVIRKNGDIRTVYTSVSSIIENQDYKGAFGIFHDITEQKRAEEELTKHRNHLEKLVKARTAELEKKNKELKRFNKLFVGREFRIKELKDKVKELKKGLGRKK